MYYYPNNAGGSFNPYMPNQFQNSTGLKGRPVSSLEEVRAAQIDFDGSLFVFPDIANNRIYTKQIALDGTASLNMYELTQIPSAPSVNGNYVTREEFLEAIKELREGSSKQDKTSQTPEPNPAFKF